MHSFDWNDLRYFLAIRRERTLAGAKQYGGSPALREAMAHGGVQGPPEITFLSDVVAV